MPRLCSWRARGTASPMSAPVARNAEMTNSNGVFTFDRYSSADQNSGECNMVFSTSRMSPSFLRKVSAIHKGLRRIVGNKTDREFARHELCRGGMPGQNMQDLQSFLFTIWFDAM